MESVEKAEVEEQPATQKDMGLQLSRLERTPDKREVGGSSPLKPTSGWPRGTLSLIHISCC